ncbi:MULTISPECIES: SDR family oxidoreductase [Luteimonas]|jgi:NAD(P)-dependent dehydrogenase (short-subunit alcohol dehydrogenase family)|uniref:SDR family oxidoreductase n=1 Tax=Luteimonas TaxID=83614 RepID=UPI000C7BDB8B|nr:MULTISPECIES: SDR family oxidoreductase [Luteimonas]
MTTSPRVALVTGATRGIGLETVRQLAEAGVHTLLAGRDRDRAVAAASTLQADGLPVEAITLDVTDAASIADAARDIEQRHGRLDILVNNAAILADDPQLGVAGQSLEAWRSTFDTNVFGLIATTQALLPLLRKSEAGRIVNVSSALGSLTLHQDPASPAYAIKAIPSYNVSKSAVNAWTVHLAHALQDTGIQVNAIHPGAVKTDGNPNGDLPVAEGAKTGVALALLGADGPTGRFLHFGDVLPW